MGFSPVVIGGVGGSGTRLIAETLRDLGIYLGNDLNAASDNLWFTLLFKRAALFPDENNLSEMNQAFDLFLNVMTHERRLTPGDHEYLSQLAIEDRLQHPKDWLKLRVLSMQAELDGEQSKLADGVPWGWKEPNSHFFVPYLASRIPALRYIHVVRHGLDMAFSENQNQLAFWGERLLGRPVDVSDPSDSLNYWCCVHERVKAYADRLQGRFLWIDFDRFCAEPEKQMPKLLEFLGVSGGDVATLSLDVEPPASTGRFRDRDLSIFCDEDLSFVQEMGFDID